MRRAAGLYSRQCVAGTPQVQPGSAAKMRYLIVLLGDLSLDFAFGEAGRDFIAYFDSA
jgi:hypothetical protein